MVSKSRAPQLSSLADMTSPAAVLEEVKYNFIHFYPVVEFDPVRRAFSDFNRLFEGTYPGYKPCNTKFHDKMHTTDALLAMSRLIDGYNISRSRLPQEEVKTALIATIFHDTGYIQRKSDKKGTGAKFTLSHVNRSIEFVKDYFRDTRLPFAMALAAGRMINCTGLSVDINDIRFASASEKTLGYMLGTADLIGQMSSRSYLERLGFLYGEFREGHVKGYSSELELLEKTLVFYTGVKDRLKDVLKNVNKYTVPHFVKRYGIKKDLYIDAIENQMWYLKEILETEHENYRNRLRRR